MSEKPESIWMVCTPIQESPGWQEGSYVAVEFNRPYCESLLAHIAQAKEINAAANKTLYRVIFFDASLHWLKEIAPLSAPDALAEVADLVAESNGDRWFELPNGHRPEDKWEVSKEAETVGIGEDDILYNFCERCNSFEFETPTLPEATLRDMLARIK